MLEQDTSFTTNLPLSVHTARIDTIKVCFRDNINISSFTTNSRIRKIFENGIAPQPVVLGSRMTLSQSIPLVLQLEIEEIKNELIQSAANVTDGDKILADFSIIFDGTSSIFFLYCILTIYFVDVSEVFNIIIRFKLNGVITQRLLALKYKQDHFNGASQAAVILKILEQTYKLDVSKHLKASIRDRASANDVVYIIIDLLLINLLDIGKFKKCPIYRFQIN